VFNKGGMIISAHQRWEKIKPKVKEVVVRETFKKPLPDGTIERGHFELNDGTKHDYSVRDWTPEKADRATIRANAQNAGEWDADILANQWEYEPEVLQDMGVPEWVFGGDGEEGGGVPNNALNSEKKDPFEDDGISGKSAYGVIIMCESEEAQETVFNKMQSDGYVCKIVVV